jgi:hypothetical protein
MQNWETLRTPVNINSEDSGYFGIELSNGTFELYTFYEHVHESGITRKDLYYTVTITAEGITVSPGRTSAYEVYGSKENSMVVGDAEGFFWIKEVWDSIYLLQGSKNIDFVFKNNTDDLITFWIYGITVNNKYYRREDGGIYFQLKTNEETTYRVSEKRLSLAYRIRITYRQHPISIPIAEYYQQIPEQIKILFNETGYEIQFVDNK